MLAVLVWSGARGDLRQNLAAVDRRTWLLLLLEGATSVLAHFAYFKALQMGNIERSSHNSRLPSALYGPFCGTVK